MKALWLRPSTGENVSVRRQRIAEKLEERGIETELCDASGRDLPTAIKTAITGEYDVLLGNVRIGLYVGFPLAKLLGKPFIGDVSDPISDIDSLPEPLFRLLRWYEWLALDRADAAVFVHDVSYKEAQKRGIDGVKLPNAVDYEAFADPNPDALMEARTILQDEGVDLEDPIAIYIGSFPESYHIEDILGAARANDDWQFVFIGTGTLEPQVRTAARTQSNVYYPGVFEYRLVPGFLNHATVGFCLTDAEQPLKLKEYGAAGLITLVPHGILNDWYDANELVFVEPTPETINETLSSIRRDPGSFEHLSSNLQDRVSEHSWEHIADGYLELFDSIVTE